MSRFDRREYTTPIALTCSICHETIGAGARASHVPMSGKWEHPACLEVGAPDTDDDDSDVEVDDDVD